MLLVFIAGGLDRPGAGRYGRSSRRSSRRRSPGSSASRTSRATPRCARGSSAGPRRSVQPRPPDGGHPLADLDRGAGDAAGLGLSRGLRPAPRHPRAGRRGGLAAPLLAAAYLTYNRAVFVALYAWRSSSAGGSGGGSGSPCWWSGSWSGCPRAVVRLVPRPGGRGAQPGARPAAHRQRPAAARRVGGGRADVPRPADHRAGLPGVSPAVGPVRRPDPQRAAQRVAPALRRERGLRRAPRPGLRPGDGRPAGSGPGWLGAGLFGSFLSVCIAASFNNVFLFNQVTIPAMVLAGTGVALAGRATAGAHERRGDAPDRPATPWDRQVTPGAGGCLSGRTPPGGRAPALRARPGQSSSARTSSRSRAGSSATSPTTAASPTRCRAPPGRARGRSSVCSSYYGGLYPMVFGWLAGLFGLTFDTS